MKNIVTKSMDIAPNDLRSMENYFSEMSSQGLHLVGITANKAEFVQGERKTVRYCFIPIDTDKLWPDPDIMDHYKASGWDSVCMYGSFYHLFSTEYPILDRLDLVLNAIDTERIN